MDKIITYDTLSNIFLIMSGIFWILSIIMWFYLDIAEIVTDRMKFKSKVGSKKNIDEDNKEKFLIRQIREFKLSVFIKERLKLKDDKRDKVKKSGISGGKRRLSFMEQGS